MNNVVNVVLLEDVLKVLVVHDVRHASDNFIDPLACLDSDDTLLLGHDRRTLVLADLLVSIDTNHEDITQGLSLTERVRVAEVHHIEAAIDPNTDGLGACRSRLGLLGLQALETTIQGRFGFIEQLVREHSHGGTNDCTNEAYLESRGVAQGVCSGERYEISCAVSSCELKLIHFTAGSGASVSERGESERNSSKAEH